MKNNKILFLFPFACLSLSAVAEDAFPAGEKSGTTTYQEGVPGGIQRDKLVLEGVVHEVNAEARTVRVTLKDGQSVTIAPRPEAVNFDQVAVGDLVRAEFNREVVMAMADPAGAAQDSSARMVRRAPEGSKPEGSAIETTRLTAEVLEIDSDTRAVALKFPDESVLTHIAREDIDLSQYKAGDRLSIVITEMIEVQVTKPAP